MKPPRRGWRIHIMHYFTNLLPWMIPISFSKTNIGSEIVRWITAVSHRHHCVYNVHSAGKLVGRLLMKSPSRRGGHAPDTIAVHKHPYSPQRHTCIMNACLMCLCSAVAVHIFATSTQSYHELCPSVMGSVSRYLRVGLYSDARLPVSNTNWGMEVTENYKSRFCMERVVGSIAQRSNIWCWA